MTEAADAPAFRNDMGRGPVRATVRGGVEPIDLLPAAGRRKLEGLTDRRDAAHDALSRRTEALREAQTDLQKARLRLAQFDDAHERGPRRVNHRAEPPAVPAWERSAPRGAAVVTTIVNPPSDDELAAERRVVEQHQRTVDRLQSEVDRLTGEWHALAAVDTGLREYLERALIGTRIKPAEAVAVTVAKGRTIREAVDDVRAEIEALNAEVVALGKAPFPSAETKASVAAMVDALAARGVPDLRGSVRYAEAPRWPETHAVEYQGGRRNSSVQQFDAPAMLAWLLRDRLIEAMGAEVDRLSDDARAVPVAERPRRLADLRARILDAGRREERLVEMAEERGEHIHRRPNVDPRAVLALDASMPAPKGA